MLSISGTLNRSLVLEQDKPHASSVLLEAQSPNETNSKSDRLLASRVENRTPAATQPLQAQVKAAGEMSAEHLSPLPRI